jgi:hypothetical protein
VTPAAAGVNSAASGVWTVREAESLKRAGTWPIIVIGIPQKAWVTAITADDQWETNTAATGTVARVTDDNPATGAGTDSNANYIQIDLGQTRTISGVFVRGLQIPGNWNSTYAAGRTISVSTNGSSFTTYSTTGTAAELNSLQVYRNGPVQARYIRLSQLNSGFLAVSEFYPEG